MAVRIRATPEAPTHLRAGEVLEALLAGRPTAVTSLTPHRLAAAHPSMGAHLPAPDARDRPGLWPAERPVGQPCIHDLLVPSYRQRTDGDRQ
jgi:hypothetical protein